LAFSYWIDKPWFLIEGKLATVLIIPSSWGSQLGGYPARINHVVGAISCHIGFFDANFGSLESC
jgi:hypothetical protein